MTDQDVRLTPQWMIWLASILVVIILIATGWFLVTLNQQSSQLVSDHNTTNQILQDILAVTNPTSAAVKAQKENTQQIENRVIVCVDNHVDRIVAALDHTTPPPLMAGCPA